MTLFYALHYIALSLEVSVRFFGLLLILSLSWQAGAANPSNLPIASHHRPLLHEDQLAVPLDWQNPNQDPINLTYRIYGQNRTDLPYLFWIGGGPAMGSIDHYFQEEILWGEGLSRHFRLVVFDPRGTGRSSPLNPYSNQLLPEPVARYFGIDSIARDLGHLIKTINVQPGHFVIAAHSAGGIVLSQYLSHSQYGPRPRSVIYGNSMTGFQNMAFVRGRFQHQIELNKKNLNTVNSARVMIARSRLTRLNETGANLPDGAVDALFLFLDSPELLSKKLAHLADPALSDEEFVKTLKSLPNMEHAKNRLLAILSALWLDGRTSLEWAELNKDLVAQEKDWMLLERRFFESIGRSPWLKQFLSNDFEIETRKAGRHYSQQFSKLEQLRQATKDLPVLALVSDEDVYIGKAASLREFNLIFNGPRHQIVTIPGGDHNATFHPLAAPHIAAALKGLEQCDAFLQKK